MTALEIALVSILGLDILCDLIVFGVLVKGIKRAIRRICW